ncbi:MAG: cytochrome c family protein [Verrucomicrobiota bacterium]|nr:cytochrome c family protein [Verrucomicrobiota bacterium]
MFRRIIFAGLLQIVTTFAAEPLQVRTDGARFVGATGCKSSSCHGGAGEKRSQYFTWSQKDFHTRAFAILTDARSQRIAETLGISSAQTSSRCTICHSPMQAIAPARLTRPIDPSESVSCESCHGAAEPWLRGHTRTDWTYATRLGAGMRDLRSFYVRANTCVACHQNLDADITRAGHPELVFELNRQSIDEPKHWRDPEGSDTRAWLVGQAVALREVSWHLAQNPQANEEARAQWQALVWLLSKVTQPGLPAIAETDYGTVQRDADTLARRAAREDFSRDFNYRLTSELASIDLPAAPKELGFACAQRLLLALQSLTRGDPKRANQLADLCEAVRSPAQFDRVDFSARLAKFRGSLSP